MTFQPLSVLKLVPHLYVMDLLDKDPGLDLLDDPKGIAWTSPKDKPDEVYCPLRDAGMATQTNTGTLRDTLKRGLRESLNRAHEALVTKYGSGAINIRVHAMGLKETNVFKGCPQPPGQPDWPSNTTTLAELGRLFESVDTKQFFPNHWDKVSAAFYGIMANGDVNGGIKAVVADEAAKAGKSAIVDAFMKKVTLVDNFTAPCNEDTAATSLNKTCSGWKMKQDATYRLFLGEPFRIAIARRSPRGQARRRVPSFGLTPRRAASRWAGLSRLPRGCAPYPTRYRSSP